MIFLALKVYPWIRNFSYIQSDINVFKDEEVYPCPPFDTKNEVISSMGGRAYPRPNTRNIARDNEVRQQFRKRRKYRLQQPMRTRWRLRQVLRRLPHRPGALRSIKRALECEEPFLRIGRWIDSLLPPTEYRATQKKRP